jgi:hypothetical protein
MTVSREASLREASKRERGNSETCQTPQGRQAILPLVFERRSAGGKSGLRRKRERDRVRDRSIVERRHERLQIENQTILIVNTSTRQLRRWR